MSGMSTLWIWLRVALLYAAFCLCYDNWRGKIRADEIERFLAAHPFKFSAIPVTASFPTAPGFALLFGSRIWVGLVLALAAALLT